MCLTQQGKHVLLALVGLRDHRGRGLAEDLGPACTITSLDLEVTTPPGQPLENWTIRLKHTSRVEYSTSPEWETNGWAVVFQGDEPAGATGWRTFDFSTPFEYNGSDNLLVDFSFNNTSWTTDGTVRSSSVGTRRSIYYRTDSGYGDPLLWTGNRNPTPASTNIAPNIRLASPDITISPSSTGNFTNGVWNGAITVNEGASQMFLRADDGNYHTGFSNLFDVTLPTLISLVSLTATAPAYGLPVDVEWVTATEIDNVGFNVYRAVTTDSINFTKGEMLNATPIAPRGSITHGAEYKFVDVEPLAQGEDRWYYLEDIDLGGARTLNGPVKAVVARSGGSGDKPSVKWWIY